MMLPMIRVLHCIYDDPRNPWVGGGGAVRLEEIYRRLARDVALTLVTGRFPGARDGFGGGIHRRRAGAARPYAWSRLTFGAAASRLLAREEYDAAVFDYSAYSPVRIPAHRPVGVMLGQLAGPTARLRWGSAAGALVSRWERRQLGRSRHVAAVSPWLLRQARPLLHPQAEARVIGVGVDARFFSVVRDEADHLLCYGRFDMFQKGIDVLLDAFTRLAAERPALQLRIAGRGRDGGRIAALVRERRLANVEVITDPEWPRLRTLLGGALALVMPSRFEGFGMVAAEAMAAGVPIVASNADALPDVVGTAGVLVPVGDPAAIVAAVAALLDDAARRARLSAAARMRARLWSWDAVAADHLAWLHAIAGQSAPAGQPPLLRTPT
jgi:glycosyltransferase involved in cell wall biosynthesis